MPESLVGLHTHLLNLKSLYRGLNWIQSCIPSRWSQHHITISGYVLGAVSGMKERKLNAHSKDQGVGEKPLDC